MLNRLLAIIAIIALSPVFLLVILLQWINFNRVFFVQTRIGKDEQPFRLFKFISMVDNKEDITGVKSRWGRFIRKYSIDELPQLLNIIRGEMNFIGPRPLLEEYLEAYSIEQRKRHRVRPGITGWAQVNGRNQMTWEQQFDYDIWFVENRNFGIYAKILQKTILKIVKPGKGENKIRQRFNGKN